MYLLFTTSQKPMARLIRWATGECCSHVAILVTDPSQEDYVVHSNIHGVNVLPLNTFLNESTILHKVELPNTWDNQERLLEILTSNKGNAYDIGALLFCGIMLFCREGLGLKWLPKQNLWQSSGMFMCTELVTEFIDGKADSLITPHQLFVRLSGE